MQGHTDKHPVGKTARKPIGGNWNALPLRIRLILSFFLATIIPMLVFTIFINSSAHWFFRQSSYEALRDAGRTAAGALYGTFKTQEHNLQALSGEPAIIELCATPPGPGHKADVMPLLAQTMKKQRPYIETLSIINCGAEVVAHTSVIPGTTVEFDRETVRLAMRSGLPAVWLSEETGESKLLFLVPLYGEDGNLVYGAALACYSPELIGDVVRRYLHRTGENGFGVIWDTQSRILADSRSRYPAGTKLATMFRDPNLLPEPGTLAFDEPQTLVLTDQDISILSAFEVLPGYQWVIMYAQPDFTISALAGNGIQMLWNMAFVLIIVLIAVSFWLSQVIARPVTSLTKTVNQIAAGDLSQRARVTSKDELGQLALSFNLMTSQMEEMVSGLAQRNEELSQLNERLRRIVTTTTRLAGPADLRRLCTIFLEELAVQLGVNGGSLYVIELGQLKLVHSLDSGHAPIVIPYPPRQGSPFAAALREGKPLLITDFSSGLVRSSGWEGYLANETLVFPLLDKDNAPVAFISLHNKKTGRFTPQDREICAVFASFGSERLRLAQARDDLAASEARYRRLVETAQEGIITVSEQEVITFANSSIARLLGFRPSELLGLSLEALVNPAHWHKIRHGTEQRRRGISSVYEVVMNTKDGRERTMQLAASPLLDKHGGYEGSLGVLTDITEYKLTHQELANQSAYLKSVFSALTDLVCVVNPDLKITEANTRFCDVFNFGSNINHNIDYISLITPQLSPSAQLSPLELVKETFATGNRNNGEVLLQSPMGERIMETDTAPLHDSTGRINGVVQVLRDVTEQRRLESQLRQAHKMEAIGRLASGIAHDFNNLLTAITGCAEIALNETDSDGPVALELREISKATQRGREIVRQILAFSRRQEQERRPVAMRTVVSEVLSLMRSSLPSAIEIHQEFNARQDTVLADAGQLHQIVMNLCTNAVQAMEHQGGRLSARVGLSHDDADLLTRHPHLPQGSLVTLTISDTGSGILPEHIERIFEPFFSTKGGQGTGLGLAVVHSNVLNHSGAIEVASTAGEGTHFTIYLPLAVEQPDQTNPIPLASHGDERVLFVDDEQLIVRTTQRLLSNLGYQVTALSNSNEALALFKEDPQAFDILITDQTMPEMTGVQLASAIMQIRADLPVILCTGYSEGMPPERARQLGISEYVMKPYSGDELGALIRKLLDSQ